MPSLPNLMSKRYVAWLPDGWRQPIIMALIASSFIHVLLLLIRWHEESEANKRLRTPLSVVLVNAKSQAPANPKRLAQADLNGGGQQTDSYASAIRRADPRLAKQLDELQAEQKRLLSTMSQGRQSDVSTTQGKTEKSISSSNPLEAELAKKINEDGIQPRRAVVTATSAKAVVFANYYDSMRKKIEAYGSAHFPRVGHKALYGSLVVLVSIDYQGNLYRDGISIMKSSGNPELDRQAVAIIRAAAPFGRFGDRMRHQIDVLDWVSTFDFTRDGNESRLDLGR